MRPTYNDYQLSLSEAKEIIREERSRKVRRLAHKLENKVYGILFIAISIIAPIVLDGDATASILFLPLGIYQIFAA